MLQKKCNNKGCTSITGLSLIFQQFKKFYWTVIKKVKCLFTKILKQLFFSVLLTSSLGHPNQNCGVNKGAIRRCSGVVSTVCETVLPF